jgi:hypothetical protein
MKKCIIKVQQMANLKFYGMNWYRNRIGFFVQY